jgi:hypothetical protein
MSYGDAWRRCASLVEAVGVGLSILVWTPATTSAVLLTVSVVAGVVVHRVSPTTRAPRLCRDALLVGAAVVTLDALDRISPALSLSLCLTALLTSPWALALVRKPSRRTGRERGSPRAGVPRRPMAELTGGELCREWRRSTLALEHARSPLELTRIAERRRDYLDEMERRSPAALHAWLSSGTQANGGPERFLLDDPRSGPPPGST